MKEAVMEGLVFIDEEEMNKVLEFLQNKGVGVTRVSLCEQVCENEVLSQLESLDLDCFSEEQTDKMAERMGILLSKNPRLAESFANYARQAVVDVLLDFDKELVEEALSKLGWEYEEEFEVDDE